MTRTWIPQARRPRGMASTGIMTTTRRCIGSRKGGATTAQRRASPTAIRATAPALHARRLSSMSTTVSGSTKEPPIICTLMPGSWAARTSSRAGLGRHTNGLSDSVLPLPTRTVAAPSGVRTCISRTAAALTWTRQSTSSTTDYTGYYADYHCQYTTKSGYRDLANWQFKQSYCWNC